MRFFTYLNILFLVPILIFYVVMYSYKYYRILIKHDKLPKSQYKKPKRQSIFYRLFIQFPIRVVKDQFENNPDFFTESGVRLIVGDQGAGKTITLCYLLQEMKARYPASQAATNFGYKYQDRKINSIDDVINHHNNEWGEIDSIDEIQNWFSSKESKDFPQEMLAEITQQRKQRKQILGTAQQWNYVSKAMRQQVSLLYEPHTFKNCLTVVLVKKPVPDKEGQLSDAKFRRAFFFVHTDSLRNSYDTYEKIKYLNLKGWKPASDRIDI